MLCSYTLSSGNFCNNLTLRHFKSYFIFLKFFSCIAKFFQAPRKCWELTQELQLLPGTGFFVQQCLIELTG